MSLRVLIVEDHVPSLELMGEILSSPEVEVRPVSDSEVASALVETQRFDGIFIDLEMPKVHGLELARRIRESSWNQSTPIVIVTGISGVETMKQGFDAGGTFFLEKPIERHKLLRLLRAVRGAMFQNRRGFVRVPLHTQVVCQSKGATMTGMSFNISRSGMLFEAPSLRSGDQVKVSFNLPGTTVTVDALATVVRIDERQRAGVRFLKVNEAGRNGIRDLVDKESE